MTKTVLRGIAIFFILLVATSVMMDALKTNFGTVNFYQKHGFFFLACITFFPRLTLVFSSVATGGFFWWLGLIFCPRILVASLATVAYFHTNPVLVTISWIVALGGETAEKASFGGKRSGFIFKTYRSNHARNDADQNLKNTVISGDGAIEAEFTKKS